MGGRRWRGRRRRGTGGCVGRGREQGLGAEELGEGSEGAAAEGFHLPEAVLRGDEALGDDEVVERCGFDGGNAVGVALDGDGSREAGDGEAAVELREGVAHGVAGPDARGEEGGDEQDERDDEGDGEIARETRRDDGLF